MFLFQQRLNRPEGNTVLLVVKPLQDRLETVYIPALGQISDQQIADLFSWVLFGLGAEPGEARPGGQLVEAPEGGIFDGRFVREQRVLDDRFHICGTGPLRHRPHDLFDDFGIAAANRFFQGRQIRGCHGAKQQQDGGGQHAGPFLMRGTP